MRQIFLDTETTGLEHKLGHRIIEIGAIELVNRRRIVANQPIFEREDGQRPVGTVAHQIERVLRSIAEGECRRVNDRFAGAWTFGDGAGDLQVIAAGVDDAIGRAAEVAQTHGAAVELLPALAAYAVSYTHLTLPTSDLV